MSTPSNSLTSVSTTFIPTPSLAVVAPTLITWLPRSEATRVRSGKTDLYSLGQLLVAFADVGHTTDATVPDGFYAETELMARFVEDLIDRDPKRRLLIFPLKNGAAEWYPELHKFFQEELDAMRLVRGDGVPKILVKLRIAPLVDLVQPLRRAPSQQ